MKFFNQAVVATSIFSSNILFWITTDYFHPNAELNPLLHNWSLSLEEQYYLFFPLILMFLWIKQRALILPVLLGLTVCSFSYGLWYASHEPSGAFYLLHTRAWELLIGAIAARYYFESTIKSNDLLSLTGICMIIGSILCIDKTVIFPSFYTLLPTIGTVLVICKTDQYSRIGRLLSTSVLVGLGLISYSAYLWHQPIFAFVRHRSLFEPSHSTFIWLILLSLALSYLSRNTLRHHLEIGIDSLGKRSLQLLCSSQGC